MFDRLATLVFRSLCMLYPAEFRRLFLDDMSNTFARQCRMSREREGSWGSTRFCIRNFTAVLIGAGAERFKTGSAGRPRFSRGSGSTWLNAVWQDIRYALRGLIKARAFTIAVLVTMAIAIGANTTIFSVVNGILLKPLPYPDADQLVRIFEQNSPTNRWALSVADFHGIEEHQQSLAAFGALAADGVTLTGGEQPERIQVGWMTADLLTTLGIQPARGRAFRAGEDRPGAPLVVIVGHAFSDRYFGVDTDALGQTLTLDGNRYTVVGVLPRGVRSLAGTEAELWPIFQLPSPTRRGPFFLRGIGRIRPGHSLDEARRDLAHVSEVIFPLWADGFQDREAHLTPVPLRDVVVGDVGGALMLLLGAAGLVLLIAIANVANLTLARATGREREMALRTSLGATRSRLARQLMVESVILAIIGGALGAVVAMLALDTLLSLSPRLPRLDEVGLDGRALGFTAVITTASGIVFGMAPIFHAWSPNLAVALHAGGRAGSEGRRWHAVRGALVTAEFALALPLLVGAALLLTSLVQMQRVDPGFDPGNLFTARVSLPDAHYPDGAAVLRFWEQALPKITELPGIESAALTSSLPPDNPGITNNFDLLDRPVAPGSRQPVVPWMTVSSAYYRTMGIPLLQGRFPDATDSANDPPVVAVSKRWAELFYPGEDVLGRQMYSGGCTSCTPTTVVGVVGDVKYTGLAGDDPGAVYMPYAQWSRQGVNLMVRTRGSSGAAMADVQRQLLALDPELPLANIETMTDRMWTAVGQPRYWAALAGVFAVVGVLLAAVGIYGVLSYMVNRRTRDIGVRMALGANAVSVWRMVVGRGMVQAVVGTGIGLIATVLLTRGLGSLLFQVSPTNPAILVATSVVLLVIALLACFTPARRATRVDPVRALAAE